jgi:hypothetical protein
VTRFGGLAVIVPILREMSGDPVVAFLSGSLGHGLLEVGGRLVPIHDAPPCLEIFGAAGGGLLPRVWPRDEEIGYSFRVPLLQI